jgi:hypothetical protein
VIAQRAIARETVAFSFCFCIHTDSLALCRSAARVLIWSGDAFMAVEFVNEPDAILIFALDVIEGLRSMNALRDGETPIEIRSGVATGPCYGGVLGSDVPRFHLAGSSVDSAVLLEQQGRPMTAMCSGTTYAQAAGRFQFEARPDIAATCEGTLQHEGVWQLMGRVVEKKKLPEQQQQQREKSTVRHGGGGLMMTSASPMPTGQAAAKAAMKSQAKEEKRSAKAAAAAAVAATAASSTPAAQQKQKKNSWV